MMKKKIGIFSAYYLPYLGGIERYIDKLAPALEKLDFEIVHIVSNHADLPSVDTIQGRTIYRLPIHNFARNRYPIPILNDEFKTLIRQIEAEDLDYCIVNTRFHLTSLVGARMSKRLGIPVVLIEHGTGHFTVNNQWFDHLGKAYEHALTRLIKRYVDRFYGVSMACNAWLRHFSITASGIFYNAIDTTDEKAVVDHYGQTYIGQEVIIAYAGRLIKEKGVLNLLEAFMCLKRKNPDMKVRMVIAGDGELFERIQKNYDHPSIDILGRLDFAHVMALYKRSDIFVYPSLYPEGLPSSILEAGLMECAVVATPRGGTREVIIDEHHGIITDGSVEDLCVVLEQLVTDPGRRKQLAQTLKRRVEKTFNWEAVAKEVKLQLDSFRLEEEWKKFE